MEKRSRRIAIGGFLHETNTFAPSKADRAAFEAGGGWPELSEGSGLIDAVTGLNLSIAGFIEGATAAGWTLAPLLWCAASPSAHVTEAAFESILERLIAALASAGPLDGVYLDLHGAMVTTHHDDGEGEILARVREVIGPDVPLVASLDLHGNVSPRMVATAAALVAYRTYPHIDMAETGSRAAALMTALLEGQRLAKAFRQLPFLIPITWACTFDEPCRSLYRLLADLEQGAIASLSFLPGFPAADILDCCPSIIAYGASQPEVDAVAERLTAAVLAQEAAFDGPIFGPEEAVATAMDLARQAQRPVIIADTQDNPGAGGNSDTTGLLRALLAQGAERAALGLIVDPEAAALAHQAGRGAKVTLALGGKSKVPGDAPLRATFEVEALSDGRFTATGPYYGGTTMALGASACLKLDGVRIVVASNKAQMADQAMFRFVGIEPADQALLVVKSSVHFRADFEPIAAKLLVCAAPGPMAADPASLPWRHLRPGLRLRPLGPVFVG